MTSPPYYFIMKKIDGKYVDRFTNPIHAISAAYEDAASEGQKSDYYHFMHNQQTNEVMVICMPRGHNKFITEYIVPDGFYALEKITHFSILMQVQLFLNGEAGGRVPWSRFIEFVMGSAQ